MAVDLDETDWLILRELQADGRVSFTELARRVHLSASATTERVKRLESTGVVRGYQAVVDLDAVGTTLLAVIRLKYFGNKHEPFHGYLQDNGQFLECLRITGEDCYVLKVGATSMAQLQYYVDDLARFGDTTTSVVYTQTLPHRGPTRNPTTGCPVTCGENASASTSPVAGGGPVSSRSRMSMTESVSSPRRAKSTPSNSNSGSSHPTPSPSTSRPPLSW
jgi:Lrp/AsnC family leucine-responsive transcriptional regulator